uniref:Uncharacterized protein n=1 Tax=Candidatus Kentrum sp. LFY TaxID=2126342 RepID=A0A450X0F7_9GAMM|nr:MAG: hypothetical protein BECKLFY1418C_GA0070996_11266 [Candidatus Kentron sp. LFY]
MERWRDPLREYCVLVDGRGIDLFLGEPAGSAEIRSCKVDFRKVGSRKVGPRKPSSLKVCFIESGSCQVGFLKPSPR